MIVAAFLVAFMQPSEPQPWFPAPEAICSQEPAGRRQVLSCALKHHGPTQIWDIASPKAVAFSIVKPTDSEGVDVVHVWVNDAPAESHEIHSGQERRLSFDGKDGPVSAKVVVETLAVGAQGISTSNVQFEWLKD